MNINVCDIVPHDLREHWPPGGRKPTALLGAPNTRPDKDGRQGAPVGAHETCPETLFISPLSRSFAFGVG